MAGENVWDEDLSATDQMKGVMKGALNRLHKEMNDHFPRLFDIDVKFGFLVDVQRLCYSRDCGKESLCDNLASVSVTTSTASNYMKKLLIAKC